ncbi:MAG: LURP-one-related family protein [Erysipelotrichaceae bacterium]|nr:LURP-one-related family protein [Erysipelotrichaceae bacterium]
MGLLPKLERYRENGESVNAEEYGEPVRSLFTSTKILSLHHKIDITDERGKTIYTARTKFPSLHDKTDLYDAKGRRVAHIEKKFFSLHERHYIDMEDGLSFQMSNELFHLIKDITNIEGLGWQLRGNILGLNFRLYDQNNEVIAAISQKLLSIHDKYCIDIYQTDKEKIVVAILITLQHMMSDRSSASSASSSSSSSSGN